MIEVEQVDFVSVPTRDPARALAVYRDVLGLSASERTEHEVETVNVTLSFWQPEAEGAPFVPNENGLALRVGDVAAACRAVEAAGVEVLGIEDTGACHMRFCKDPDGNVVILHRRYAA